MNSRWLNESNLSPFFICCAGAWQGQAGEGRRRRVALGTLGSRDSPGDVPFAPQTTPYPAPIQTPGGWICSGSGKAIKSWSGSMGEQPSTPRSPPHPLPGATCTFPATSCTWKIPNSATPRLLSLYSSCAGSEMGWGGLVWGRAPPLLCPSLSSPELREIPTAEPEVSE